MGGAPPPPLGFASGDRFCPAKSGPDQRPREGGVEGRGLRPLREKRYQVSSCDGHRRGGGWTGTSARASLRLAVGHPAAERRDPSARDILSSQAWSQMNGDQMNPTACTIGYVSQGCSAQRGTFVSYNPGVIVTTEASILAVGKGPSHCAGRPAQSASVIVI